MTTARLAYWKDKRIEDLTRDELLDVVQWLAADLQRAHDQHSQTLASWTACIDARKKNSSYRWPWSK